MVRCRLTIAGLLVFLISANAAPSDQSNIEEPVNKESEQIKDIKIPIEFAEPKLDSLIPDEESKNKESLSQNLRQKRFYNFYGYGVPPINPVIYPTYNKRDQSAETGVYGYVDDPLEQIQKRLQDIASFVRQPIPPPLPPAHFPFFFPVIYIPQYGCDCNSNSDNIPPPTENPVSPSPQTPKPGTNMTVDERFPQLDDERQNWGLTTNETDTQYDEEEFARPISFDPIQPSQPTMRPAPPVEHGSSQGNSESLQTTTTTARPRNTTRRPQISNASPGSSQPAHYPSNIAQVPRSEQPTTCDAAILSCCHQTQITYDCFVVQGCPDTTAYGNPCDTYVILQVIDKFQKFYGVRNGN